MDNFNNNLTDQPLTKKERHLLKKQQREQEYSRLVGRKKIKKALFILLPIILIAGGVIYGLLNLSQDNQNNKESEKIKATVFYSPTCSCCQEYIPYLKRQGFSVEAKSTRDMLSIKEQYQIPSKLESCHTTIIGDYFIEGHMPIEAIKKLLEEKPDILGIGLPGMPLGAPGMGGIKKQAFEIYGLSKDGEVIEFLSL